MEARLGHQLDRLPERTIRDVRLFEFGPTTWPAYSDATAGLGGQWTPARWEGRSCCSASGLWARQKRGRL